MACRASSAAAVIPQRLLAASIGILSGAAIAAPKAPCPPGAAVGGRPSSLVKGSSWRYCTTIVSQMDLWMSLFLTLGWPVTGNCVAIACRDASCLETSCQTGAMPDTVPEKSLLRLITQSDCQAYAHHFNSEREARIIVERHLPGLVPVLCIWCLRHAEEFPPRESLPCILCFVVKGEILVLDKILHGGVTTSLFQIPWAIDRPE